VYVINVKSNCTIKLSGNEFLLTGETTVASLLLLEMVSSSDLLVVDSTLIQDADTLST